MENVAGGRPRFTRGGAVLPGGVPPGARAVRAPDEAHAGRRRPARRVAPVGVRGRAPAARAPVRHGGRDAPRAGRRHAHAAHKKAMSFDVSKKGSAKVKRGVSFVEETDERDGSSETTAVFDAKEAFDPRRHSVFATRVDTADARDVYDGDAAYDAAFDADWRAWTRNEKGERFLTLRLARVAEAAVNAGEVLPPSPRDKTAASEPARSRARTTTDGARAQTFRGGVFWVVRRVSRVGGGVRDARGDSAARRFRRVGEKVRHARRAPSAPRRTSPRPERDVVGRCPRPLTRAQSPELPGAASGPIAWARQERRAPLAGARARGALRERSSPACRRRLSGGPRRVAREHVVRGGDGRRVQRRRHRGRRRGGGGAGLAAKFDDDTGARRDVSPPSSSVARCALPDALAAKNARRGASGPTRPPRRWRWRACSRRSLSR